MGYTEFYCQNGGSNLNAGSTTNNTAPYTSIHGNWSTSTRVFTPTDGSTPSSTVSVGDFASVYIDGASIGVYIGRITAVGAGVNGTITVPGANACGASPANQTGTATIKVGGAWQGPNGASGFPLTLTSFGGNKNASGEVVRVNMKNDQTYTMTATFAPVVVGSGTYTVQGYSSTVNDGGRATFDGTTSVNQIFSNVPAGVSWIDLIFKTSFASSSGDLVTVSNACSFIRCVFTGSRGHGLSMTGGVEIKLVECEAYDNNKSNSVNKGGFASSAAVDFIRCIAHDNTGSNTAGFFISSNNGQVLEDCIADTNGGNGLIFTGTSSGDSQVVKNCDFYNNGADAINFPSNSAAQAWIENCNFIKNTGAGINNASTTLVRGFVYNCGYGAGTQANGSADTIGNLYQAGTVTYASNTAPWVDPANGDFRINLATAEGAGRGAFTQTASSYTGAVGYPDIGAAQAQVTASTTYRKSSHVFCG